MRNRDIDALRHQELVIQLAQTKGEVTRADVVELLHVTPPQAYRILKKLKDGGQLSLEGNGAGARYALSILGIGNTEASKKRTHVVR